MQTMCSYNMYKWGVQMDVGGNNRKEPRIGISGLKTQPILSLQSRSVLDQSLSREIYRSTLGLRLAESFPE